MEYLEILLSDINRKYLDIVLTKEFGFTNKNIISSHFYSKEANKDLEYEDIISLNDYFSVPNIGNIYVESLSIGQALSNVMIVMSFDDDYGDIVLNFSDNIAKSKTLDEIKNMLQNISEKLIDIQRKYNIKEIRFGYEPIIDCESCLYSIINGKLNIINRFKGNISNAVEDLRINNKN